MIEKRKVARRERKLTPGGVGVDAELELMQLLGRWEGCAPRRRRGYDRWVNWHSSATRRYWRRNCCCSCRRIRCMMMMVMIWVCFHHLLLLLSLYFISRLKLWTIKEAHGEGKFFDVVSDIEVPKMVMAGPNEWEIARGLFFFFFFFVSSDSNSEWAAEFLGVHGDFSLLADSARLRELGRSNFGNARLDAYESIGQYVHWSVPGKFLVAALGGNQAIFFLIIWALCYFQHLQTTYRGVLLLILFF